MMTLNYLKHLKNLKQKQAFLYQTLFNFLMAIFIKKGLNPVPAKQFWFKQFLM